MEHTCVVRIADLDLHVGGKAENVVVTAEATIDTLTLTFIRNARSRATLRVTTRAARHIMFSIGRALRDVMLSRPFLRGTP
jgi:hypothetical protein